MDRNDLFFMGALVAAAGALSWALNELSDEDETIEQSDVDAHQPQVREREIALEVVSRKTNCAVPPGLERRAP